MHYRFIIKRNSTTNEDAPDYIEADNPRMAAIKAYQRYGSKAFPNGYNGNLLYNLKGKELRLAKATSL